TDRRRSARRRFVRVAVRVWVAALALAACDGRPVEAPASGAGGSGGAPTSCVVDGDCGPWSQACGGPRCEAGVCVLDYEPMGTPCHEGVCTGDGHCAACVLDSHCESGRCIEGGCAPASCGDGVVNGGEGDVD